MTVCRCLCDDRRKRVNRKSNAEDRGYSTTLRKRCQFRRSCPLRQQSDEYQFVSDALALAGLSDEEARQWLDRTRECGLENRFTIGRPNAPRLLDLFNNTEPQSLYMNDSTKNTPSALRFLGARLMFLLVYNIASWSGQSLA